MKLLNKNNISLKQLAASASIITALFLAVLKAFASYHTGSLSILSSMIDSLADILASVITYVAVHYSDKPLTDRHRYGYGKIESVSALFQAAFIVGSAGFILYDAFYRFIFPQPLNDTFFGIVIMIVSLVVTVLLVSFQKYVVNKIKSPAINADSQHYVVDILSNGAVIVSLLAVKIFAWNWFDILTAMGISVYLLYNAWQITVDAIDEITDKEVDDKIKAEIIKCVADIPEIKGYHDLRTRLSGTRLFVEIHLEFDGMLVLQKVHQITEMAENKIIAQYPQAQIIIHQDPYGIREKRLDHDIKGKCLL